MGKEMCGSQGPGNSPALSIQIWGLSISVEPMTLKAETLCTLQWHWPQVASSGGLISNTRNEFFEDKDLRVLSSQPLH